MRVAGFLGGLAAMVAAIGVSSSDARAIEAAAISPVNVRLGPSIDYGVVDTLHPGEIVDVVECNASNTWCRIFHEGPDGWVSRRFLGAPPVAGESPMQFGFSIPLPGGGSITFGTPGYTPPGGGMGPGPGPGPAVARVCVYDLPDFSGPSVCVHPGASDANVTGAWNNKVSSLTVEGGAAIRLCQNRNYGGVCNVFNSNRPVLGPALNNQASSYDVLPGEPARVCAYNLANFQGQSVCIPAGASDDNLGPVWNNKVTSLKVFGNAEIRLCQDPGFGGFCNQFRNNVAMLGGPLNNNASSYRTGVIGAGLSSDERLKTGIVRLATLDHDISLYEYSLIGESKRRIGVMAQEVAGPAPHALSRDDRGYYLVDYDALFADRALARALRRSGYWISP